MFGQRGTNHTAPVWLQSLEERDDTFQDFHNPFSRAAEHV